MSAQPIYVMTKTHAKQIPKALRPTIIGNLTGISANWYFRGEPLYRGPNSVTFNWVAPKKPFSSYGLYQLVASNSYGESVSQVLVLNHTLNGK